MNDLPDPNRFITIKALSVTRRPSSTNGNPRWRFTTQHGWFDTEVDSHCALEIAGSEHRLIEHDLKIWLTADGEVWKFELSKDGSSYSLHEFYTNHLDR